MRILKCPGRVGTYCTSIMPPVYGVNSAKITELGTTSAPQQRPKRRNPIKGVLFEAIQLLSN